MLKKFLSVIMTAAMVLALAIPAFAAESFNEYGAADGDRATDPESSKIDVTADLKTPTLKIGVGRVAGVVFNPYQMKVTLDSTNAPTIQDGAATLATNSQDQVISNETTIVNFSNVPVKMYAKGVATEGIANLEFTDDHINDDEHEKRVHLFCEVIRNDTGTGPKLEGDDDANDYTEFYATQMADNDEITNRQGWDNRKNQIRISTDTRDDYDNEENYVMIFTESTNALGTLPTSAANVQNSAKGRMKFFGSMTKNPTLPWGSDDAVQFTMTMKFAMMENSLPET